MEEIDSRFNQLQSLLIRDSAPRQRFFSQARRNKVGDGGEGRCVAVSREACLSVLRLPTESGSGGRRSTMAVGGRIVRHLRPKQREAEPQERSRGEDGKAQHSAFLANAN